MARCNSLAVVRLSPSYLFFYYPTMSELVSIRSASATTVTPAQPLDTGLYFDTGSLEARAMPSLNIIAFALAALDYKET